MANLKPLAVVWVALVFAGCATSPVLKGAIFGGASGAALGAGTGVLISDEDLLGSSTAPATGNISLDSGPTVAAGAVIGLLFGALAGAMVGHGHDDGDEEPSLPSPAPTAQAEQLRPTAF